MWKLADIYTEGQWGRRKCTCDYSSQYFRHTVLQTQKVKILKQDKKCGLKCKFWINNLSLCLNSGYCLDPQPSLTSMMIHIDKD